MEGRHVRGPRGLRSRARRATAATALLAALVAGCNGAGDDEKSSKKADTTAAGAARGESALARRGSPGAAVLALWDYLQIGAVPAAVLSYDPSVRRAVGVADLAGALSDQEAEVRLHRPRVVSARRTPAGTLVVLEAKGPERRLKYSYFLRRTRGEWRVVYDSLLHSGLKAYVAGRAQNDLTPAPEPSPAARAAGAEAASRFRAVAIGAR